MRRLVAVSLLALFASSVRAQNRAIGQWLGVHRLTDDAYVVTEPRCFAANTLVVRMDDGSVVLCDAPVTAIETQALLDWSRATLGRPIDVAINSHFHADASGGNDVLIRAGVTVYGSERTAALIRERGESMKQILIESFAGEHDVQSAIRATTFVPPSRTFPEGEGLELQFGDETVRIIDPGAAHSEDNCVTYFPSKRILFGSCMIRGGESIGYVGNANVDHWPTAVRSLLDLDVQFVIPGHGAKFSPSLLKSTIDVVDAYRASSGTSADKN